MIRHLYIHIPFCHHICPYCAFYKHKPGTLANREFIDALLEEARCRAGEMEVGLETIYFGGGTPSMLSASHLERLCDGLRDVFDLSRVQEWTLESNPATFDARKVRLMRDLGITRPSLGVQSFDPRILSTLGRDHSSKDAIEAYRILREAEFPAISLDLMFSIPGQSFADWESDLEQAIRLQPDHVSCYNLTYEEDTDFLRRHTRGELDADEDRDAKFFYRGIELLEAAGYRHYEISNYAIPGFESIHNQAYWSGADYLGLGPGAVSTLDGVRWKTVPDTAGYVHAVGKGEEVKVEVEHLTSEDRRLEAIALQLRTASGVPGRFFEKHSPVDSLADQGLLVKKGDRYCLTHEGKALADPVTAALI